MKFIVFQDALKGMVCLSSLESNTLEGAIDNIHMNSSPMYMYYIYQTHSIQIPYLNTKVNVYKFVKAIAGKQVVPILINHKVGLLYAIDALNENYNWIFTDIIFKE